MKKIRIAEINVDDLKRRLKTCEFFYATNLIVFNFEKEKREYLATFLYDSDVKIIEIQL